MELNTDKLILRNDNVLVRAQKAPQKSAGGITLPESLRKQMTAGMRVGTVLAIGPGTRSLTGERQAVTHLAVGDMAFFDSTYAKPLNADSDEFDYLVVPERAIDCAQRESVAVESVQDAVDLPEVGRG